MKFYGFAFEDGLNTTTGGSGCLGGGRVHTAGRLVVFATRRERDAWVGAGCPFRVPRDQGEFRLAVRARDMTVDRWRRAERWSLVGWRRRDAEAA